MAENESASHQDICQCVHRWSFYVIYTFVKQKHLKTETTSTLAHCFDVRVTRGSKTTHCTKMKYITPY